MAAVELPASLPLAATVADALFLHELLQARFKVEVRCNLLSTVSRSGQLAALGRCIHQSDCSSFSWAVRHSFGRHHVLVVTEAGPTGNDCSEHNLCGL